MVVDTDKITKKTSKIVAGLESCASIYAVLEAY
jgi:hypothetical protein